MSKYYSGVKISSKGFSDVHNHDVYSIVDSIRRSYGYNEKGECFMYDNGYKSTWNPGGFTERIKVVINGATLTFTPKKVVASCNGMSWNHWAFNVITSDGMEFYAKSVQQGITNYVEHIIDNCDKIVINNVAFIITDGDTTSADLIENLIKNIKG